MSSFFKGIAVFALTVATCLSVCLPAVAQSSLGQILQPAVTPAPSGSPTDPLGRTTPSGTVYGFLQAAEQGNNSIAAQYLQMSAARRMAEADEIVPKLMAVLNDNRFFSGRPGSFTQAEGIPQEGVPLGRQKVGTASAGDVEVDIELIRLSSPSGKIWLFSEDTVAKIPEIYDQIEARQVETWLGRTWVPKILVNRRFGGLPIWQWLGLLLGIPVAAGVGWLVIRIIGIPMGWWARRRGQVTIATWRSMSAPAWLLIGTVTHRIFVRYLNLPLLQRHYYGQVTTVALIIGANWILWRVVQWFMRRVRDRALTGGHSGTGSLIVLGERIVKALIFVMALFSVLGSLGFNLSTALAGLGIGGLAIGFGAQKTIENLFGGMSVLGDEAIRVGDVCKFGDRTGTVEDIGLRSTRVRTEERTLLTIPNGTVAAMNVENLSRRDKMLFKTTLGLRSETTPDHLRYVLAEVRRLLYSHAKVELKTVRVRLVELGSSSLNAEVAAYILTRDFNEFAAVREDLLLRMMDVVNDSGTGFAFPSQTLYLGKDSGLEKEKADNAVKKVAELRDTKKLPFPDFPQEDISSFQGSIDYPQPESAVRNQQTGTGPKR